MTKRLWFIAFQWEVHLHSLTNVLNEGDCLQLLNGWWSNEKLMKLPHLPTYVVFSLKVLRMLSDIVRSPSLTVAQEAIATCSNICRWWGCNSSHIPQCLLYIMRDNIYNWHRFKVVKLKQVKILVKGIKLICCCFSSFPFWGSPWVRFILLLSEYYQVKWLIVSSVVLPSIVMVQMIC